MIARPHGSCRASAKLCVPLDPYSRPFHLRSWSGLSPIAWARAVPFRNELRTTARSRAQHRMATPCVKGFEASSHVNRLASRTDPHCGPRLKSTN